MAFAEADVVIVGAGHAGSKAAEAIRAVNSNVTIAVVGAERHLPYERPPLSKSALADPSKLVGFARQSAVFYADKRITLRLGDAVTDLDRTSRVVRLAGGDRLRYRKLILSTGSRPRRLSLEKSRHLHYLRTVDDALGLSAKLKPGSHLCVVGGGFIGLEVAATARSVGCQVTVLESSHQILGRVLPPFVSSLVQQIHERNGVTFRTGTSIQRIEDREDACAAVLSDGSRISCDAVLIGVGIEPNVELAVSAGLGAPDGIAVDEYGRTEDPSVFACGEVTLHPVSGQLVRRESWQVAEFQSVAVGRTAGGTLTSYAAIPWVWSDQGSLNLQVLGIPAKVAQWVTREAGRERLCYFGIERARLTGAIAVNSGREISLARRLISSGIPVTPGELADAATPLHQALAKTAS